MSLTRFDRCSTRSCPLATIVWVSIPSGAQGRRIRAGPIQPRCLLPILSENCFLCHGPDAKTRKADLRLDLKDGALRHGRADHRAWQVQRQRAVRRDHQPRPRRIRCRRRSRVRSSLRQIASLKTWIDQGASWSKHWAFEPPVTHQAPIGQNGSWPRNPIDAFVLARLEAEGLSPSRRGSDDLDSPPRSGPHRPAANTRGCRRVPGFAGSHGASRHWRTVCSPRQITASAWRWIGWTGPVTPTPTAFTRRARTMGRRDG